MGRVAWMIVYALTVNSLATAAEPGKSFRLPAVDLKQNIIWGSECTSTEGLSLAFGGQDQTSADGNPHTRVKIGGEWQPIFDELEDKSPCRVQHAMVELLAQFQRRELQAAQHAYFQGQAKNGEVAEAVVNRIKALRQQLQQTQQLADLLRSEPPPRALSNLIYEPRHQVFVLFGGDHCDYLTNDTWVFDVKRWRWEVRHCRQAPPPRANHTLVAIEDGKIVLRGGYTYTSNTDYVGGQYRDWNDGEWTFDLDRNQWTGSGNLAEANTRVYRTGRLHPDWCLDGPPPEPDAFAKFLQEMPENTWVETKAPRLPAMNRDWGSAILDPHRDLMLRWSGGHSAHGGTDVLHYHCATNRWELSDPIEFPLGQTYSNTEYPEGWNFNHRPWVTGHTYQSYGFDPESRLMIFTGRRNYAYAYDADRADWVTRWSKPAGMNYGSAYYTLTLCNTPTKLYCWTAEGKIFQWDGRANEWHDVPLHGEKLPGSIVDNSTMTFDRTNQRFLCFRKPYGDQPRYDGTVYEIRMPAGEVHRLEPAGRDAAADIPYLCQIRCHHEQHVALVGGTLPPDEQGARWTPIFDLAKDRWMKIKLTGDDPNGPKGRNVSLGLMYDAHRKLFWAVDTNCHVYVLRLNVCKAGEGLRPL